MVKDRAKMVAVEFEAYIRNGMIEIPAEQRTSLVSYNAPVRIIVLAKENGLFEQEKAAELTPRLQDAREKGYDSFIEYLMDYPVIVPNITYLSREEANER